MLREAAKLSRATPLNLYFLKLGLLIIFGTGIIRKQVLWGGGLRDVFRSVQLTCSFCTPLCAWAYICMLLGKSLIQSFFTMWLSSSGITENEKKLLSGGFCGFLQCAVKSENQNVFHASFLEM